MKKLLFLLPLPFLNGCALMAVGMAIGLSVDQAQLENKTTCQNESLIKTIEYSTKSAVPLESSELRILVDNAFKECMKGKFGEEIPSRIRSEEEICRSKGRIYNPNMPTENKCY